KGGSGSSSASGATLRDQTSSRGTPAASSSAAKRKLALPSRWSSDCVASCQPRWSSESFTKACSAFALATSPERPAVTLSAASRISGVTWVGGSTLASIAASTVGISASMPNSTHGRNQVGGGALGSGSTRGWFSSAKRCTTAPPWSSTSCLPAYCRSTSRNGT